MFTSGSHQALVDGWPWPACCHNDNLGIVPDCFIHNVFQYWKVERNLFTVCTEHQHKSTNSKKKTADEKNQQADVRHLFGLTFWNPHVVQRFPRHLLLRSRWCCSHMIQIIQQNYSRLTPNCLMENFLEQLPKTVNSLSWKIKEILTSGFTP